ncbi:MAG: hypothetical protein ABF289_13635 [Clostridiales bacterium]
MKNCFNRQIQWETDHYGIDAFRKDKIIRISRSKEEEKAYSWLGYKEKDFGEMCNIRKEIDEDITNGIIESDILKIIGIDKSFDHPEAIEYALNKKHKKFMSFSGSSILGYQKEFDFKLKFMYCNHLKYPYLLEIEREEIEYNHIGKHVKDIESFIAKYNLEGLKIKEEPPTLLYNTL